MWQTIGGGLKKMNKEKQILITDEKIQMKLQKALGDIFSINKDIDTRKKDIPLNFVIMDISNICIIVIKDPLMFDILRPFTFQSEYESNVPHLDYKGKKDIIIRSKYSSYYMTSIYNVFSVLNESPIVYINKDYPITLKGKYFDFILAPQIIYEED